MGVTLLGIGLVTRYRTNHLTDLNQIGLEILVSARLRLGLK